MANAIFWDVTLCYLVGTDVSEERITSISRVTRIGKLGTSTVTSNLMAEAIISPETPVLTRATRCHILEDGTLHSNRLEKSQILYSINRLGSIDVICSL
jgi:hypothetical protein